MCFLNFRSFDHASFGKGKGCAMFSLASRNLSHIRHKISTSNYQIMSVVDETEQNRPYQLVLVYCSSGCPFQKLVHDLEKILQPNITTLITGDFNFDTKETNSFTNFMKKRMFTQLVKWPTHKKGRTIDHLYVSKNTQVNVTRHSPYYSDHDALCIEFENFP